MDSHFEIVVVGGGISGLSTCYFLKKLAANVNREIHLTLVEAESRFGGKITTDVQNGLTIEGGPDSFLTLKPWALDLCKELGLGEDLVAANSQSKGTYVLNHGKLYQLPEGTETGMPSKLSPFLQSNLLSLSGKMRAMMDVVIPKRKETSDESVGSFITRRFGKEFLEKIVEPLYAGIFAGDVSKLSVRAVLPRMVEIEKTDGSLIRGFRRIHKNLNSRKLETRGPAFMTLKGGLGQLIDRLVARLDESSVTILRDSVVQVREYDEAEQKRYEILLEAGERIRADVVVLATPAFVSSKIIRELDSKIASILDTISYVSTATVSLAFDKSKIEGNVKGHGFLVPRSEKELITGCTWESSKWPRRAPPEVVLARCYTGWYGHEEFAQLDDRMLLERTVDFLNRTTGISERPFFSKIYRWNKALPQYIVEHLERMASLSQLLEHHKALFLTGAAFRGVGLPDCIHDAYLTAATITKIVQDRKANQADSSW